MIELRRGDLFEADAEALVNTVNCVGVMGRGIALQFRKAFPENYKEYKAICARDELHPGVMFIHERLNAPRYIINFPTKRHWRGKSRMEDIEAGLKTLVEEVRTRGIRSIAIPPLGSGLGGLDWADVRPRIETAFQVLPEIQVQLFEPGGAPAPARMARAETAPKMTTGRAALLGLMRRYLAAAMDPAISLLEIHKLLYFMQAGGEKLRLRYAKGPYGPYAENLRHLLNLIEGHFITGYGDAEDRPDKQIELRREASEQAKALLTHHPATQKRFVRVGDLIEGFETPFGMELLATVHWVATHEGATNADDAVALTYAWNPRKRMFREEHVHRAWDELCDKCWIVAA